MRKQRLNKNNDSSSLVMNRGR